MVNATSEPAFDRTSLSEKFLRGSGIEIGALHNPLKLAENTQVKYVDRMTVRELREHYPTLSAYEFVPVDLVDNGETLSSIGDDNLDFVIANHFLEHCEDPIKACLNFLRVLKPGGILYLAIPDKRRTFDRERPVTTLSHLIEDFERGPERSREAHYLEWVRLVDKAQGKEGEDALMRERMGQNFSIHFHVWTEAEMRELIDYIAKRSPLTVLESVSVGNECIFIIQKTGNDRRISLPFVHKKRENTHPMYAFFALLKRGWTAAGEPWAGSVRHIRHAILGRWWPSDRSYFPAPVKPVSSIVEKNTATADIAVIIPCHNYGKFLSRAIDSVLAQTLQPKDILVVDDSSTDDTKDVALRYSGQGVRYLRVEHRSLSHTRNSGALATESKYLLFLDADDYLQEDYLASCLKEMTGPEVAVVYCDRQQFGDNTFYMKTPEYDYDLLTRGNYISSHSLILRQAFDLVGGFRQIDHSLEDWDFYRRVLALPFVARKGTSLVHYNVHEDSMLQTLVKGPHWSYAHEAAIMHHPITIFTPFAGRMEVFERYLEGLLNLECDQSMIHLHWYNTSDNPAFDAHLRSAIARLPFGSVTYTKAPLPALWNRTPEMLIKNRITKMDETEYYYQLAVVRAFNEMISRSQTEYILTLEDDMHLQPETLKLLAGSMERDTAAVVAPYKSGFYPRYEIWMPEGTLTRHFTEKQTGIREVGGSGFGCTLFRTDMLKKVAPIFTGVRDTPKQWYDQATYLRLARHGKILCNWDAEVEHMQTERYKETLSPAFV